MAENTSKALTRQKKYANAILQQHPSGVAEKPEMVFCLLTTVSNVIGGKWKIQVLAHLSEEGTMRFGELKRVMPEVSEKMLIQALKELESDGLIVRHQFPEIPPRVEYTLSESGIGLKPVIEKLMKWGATYIQKYRFE